MEQLKQQLLEKAALVAKQKVCAEQGLCISLVGIRRGNNTPLYNCSGLAE
jgi:hypothetical protein